MGWWILNSGQLCALYTELASSLTLLKNIRAKSIVFHVNVAMESGSISKHSCYYYGFVKVSKIQKKNLNVG